MSEVTLSAYLSQKYGGPREGRRLLLSGPHPVYEVVQVMSLNV
jgi:hypothetical protein